MLSYRSKRGYRAASKLRAITGVSFATAFAALGAYLLISAHASTTEQPSVNWRGSNSELLNSNANLCLGTPGNAKPAAGATVIIENCSAVDSEKWSLTWGSGAIKSTTVVNGYGQCLDDRGSNAGVGTTVRIATCTAGSTAQSWTTGYGDGTIHIDGLCLGVSGNSKLAGTNAILTPCTTPEPSVSLASPASGSTVSGTATVTASASISQDSIAKITLQVGNTVLKICVNATSCSAKWDTTTLSDGTYTLTAVATGTLGGTATTSETVASSNASSSGGSSDGSGGGDSGGDGSDGSISVCDPSDPTCNGDTTICDPSDPTCTGDTCDPSDPTCSNDVTTCDPSDPTCDTSTSTDTTGSTGSSSHQSHRTKSKKATEGLNSGKTSVAKVLGVSASLLALIIMGFLVFVYFRKRKQAGAQPAYDSTDFFTHVAPPAGGVTTFPANSQPTAQPTQEASAPAHTLSHASLPTEDYAHAEARLNWWDTQASQHPVHPAAGQDNKADQPLDMFEEGRKRLEEEGKDGSIKL